jgi:hypothetical protein
MTKERIRQLATLIPDDSAYFESAVGVADLETAQGFLTERDRIILSDPAFGWHLVKALIKAGKKLPPWVDEDYIRRAYTFETKARIDYPIMEAITLMHPQRYFMRDIFRACLVTEALPYTIAEKLGYNVETVLAFEQLFFNVRDRKADYTYLGSLVYEDGILVEHKRDYITNEPFGNILIRAGFKNGINDVCILAGILPGNKFTMDAYESASRVEAMFMDNADVLARNGLINQKLVGLTAARNLITAAKMSGQTQSAVEAVGLMAVGQTLITEMEKFAPGRAKELIAAETQLASLPKELDNGSGNGNGKLAIDVEEVKPK